MTDAIYNEIDPFAADWLERLIETGNVGPGRVDRRSIVDLKPADVAGGGQRHFFAGIGGWSYALRRAGVPDTADVWTGSCPCQPFSGAGKRGGVGDARHLWPAWFALIEQCRPAVIFGEQVASRDGLAWLDLVFSDLERCGYTVGAADLCAAGVGAPHIRQRLFFVAHATGFRRIEGIELQSAKRRSESEVPEADRRRAAGELADSTSGTGRLRVHSGPQGAQDLGRPSSRSRRKRDASQSASRKLGNAAGAEQPRDAERREVSRAQAESSARLDGGLGSEHSVAAGRLGDAGCYRAIEHARELPSDEGEHALWTADRDHASIIASATRGFWADADWLPCADGVSRPVEPGTFPLAHGVPARVGRLRGYGNAIVTEAAIAFIKAAIAARDSLR